MTTSNPTELSERSLIVDIIRGFALVGVLFANFTSYTEQHLPSHVLDSISTPLDKALLNFNAIFIEWKFITLFSILFGYGFGLILISLEKKAINPIRFFARRMIFLFVLGILHTLFWLGDVLHFYAIMGMFLLFFRKGSMRTLLVAFILCTFVLAPGVDYLFRHIPDFFTDENLQVLYEEYKHGSIKEVFHTNILSYYRAFIITGDEIGDFIDTLGIFLLGFFLLRVKLFEAVEVKGKLFRKILLISAPLMICYFVIRWMNLQEILATETVYWQILMKIGILSTTCNYVCLLTLAFIKFKYGFAFHVLQALGKMTLTNYLFISAFSILLLYGIGFGKLGDLPITITWIMACLWLAFEIIFSLGWLKRFRFGPMEWIWRQWTYRKWIQLKKAEE